MYGYQVVFEDPGQRNRRVVLQVLSKRKHSTVASLLRTEKLSKEYANWLLVDFRAADRNNQPALEEAREELAPSGSLISLVA